MKLLVTGQNDLSSEDLALISTKCKEWAQDEEIAEVIIVVTAGTANFGTNALGSMYLARMGQFNPLVTAAVQNVVADLSVETRKCISEFADQVVEFKLGNNREGYNRFYTRVPDLVMDQGGAVAFWKGSYLVEPWDIIRQVDCRRSGNRLSVGLDIITVNGQPAEVHTAPMPRARARGGS